MPVVSTWSRSHRCSPAVLHRPTTEEALRAVLPGDHRLKVIGAGHSFSALAMTEGHLVSLDALDQLLSIDRQAGLVTVQAGCRLAAFNAALAAQGLALPIVGSIAAQSLAGLCATGTHGSSLRHGNLSSLVMGARLLTPQGEVQDIGPDDIAITDDFDEVLGSWSFGDNASFVCSWEDRTCE
jgi:L-gulonolactone oxidase